MISDLQTLVVATSSQGQPISVTLDESRVSELAPLPPFAAGLPVPHGTASLIQPVPNVPAYLLTRQPVADCHAEEPLLITLPRAVRAEVASLCRACSLVLKKVQGGSKVQPACVTVITFFPAFNTGS